MSSGIQRVERLFYILQYLSNHDTATARELAEHCQTSIRTIYRDMRTLEELGFYYTNEGKQGYRLIYQPIRLENRLTKDEWMALTLYPILSEGITSKSHPLHYAYRSGLEKISTFVMKDESLEFLSEGIGERIRPNQRMENANDRDIIPAFLQALANNRTIEAWYYSMHREEKSFRKLDPYYLVPRNGHLYLIAFCHLRSEVRVFRLSRFEQVTLTEHVFKIPKTFSIEDFLAKRWSIIASDSDTTFTVRFTGEAIRYVMENEYYVDTKKEEQEDGSLELTVTVKSQKEFLRWVRSFGLNAEVLYPLEVREELKKEYETMYKRYQTSTLIVQE